MFDVSTAQAHRPLCAIGVRLPPLLQQPFNGVAWKKRASAQPFSDIFQRDVWRDLLRPDRQIADKFARENGAFNAAFFIITTKMGSSIQCDETCDRSSR